MYQNKIKNADEERLVLLIGALVLVAFSLPSPTRRCLISLFKLWTSRLHKSLMRVSHACCL